MRLSIDWRCKYEMGLAVLEICLRLRRIKLFLRREMIKIAPADFLRPVRSAAGGVMLNLKLYAESFFKPAEFAFIFSERLSLDRCSPGTSLASLCAGDEIGEATCLREPAGAISTQRS